MKFSLHFQYSWTNFIYTRCQNINRKSKSSRRDDSGEDEPLRGSKKRKVDPEKHSYPSLAFEAEDEVAFERNVSLMKQELSKPKPQPGNVIMLMSHTFAGRRQWILDEINGVEEICEKYPCLSKAAFVSDCMACASFYFQC